MLVEADEEAGVGASRPDRPAAPDIASRSLWEAEDARRCYLLFAGLSEAPTGGLGDLVGTFRSEDAAREAFRDIRLNGSSPRSWAQLAVVEGQGIKPLCWFGIGATPAKKPPVEASKSPSAGDPMSTGGPKAAPTARRGLAKRITATLIGLLARRSRHAAVRACSDALQGICRT